MEPRRWQLDELEDLGGNFARFHGDKNPMSRTSGNSGPSLGASTAFPFPYGWSDRMDLPLVFLCGFGRFHPYLVPVL